MKDLQGREYARLGALKAGDVVLVDGDFDCMKSWSEREVQEDEDGEGDDRLWIKCKHIRHYLSGQLRDNEDYLVGIYPQGTPPGAPRMQKTRFK